MNQSAYRADIDGLRAVAVLAVVVFHAFPRVLPGGFCGVDVFFVISGYLISLIIFRGLQAGTFRFSDFYARRVRRLFPALLVLMVLCLLAGYVMLLPTEFEELGKTTAAGTIFVQNIVFSKETGYFATSSDLVPLLHLWSLAVEEQFYILFPPLLVLLWRKRTTLPLVLGVLMLGSLAWGVHAAATHQTGSFYLTHLRAWEFLAGTGLAWAHTRNMRDGTLKRGSWLAAGGAALLLASFLLIDSRSPYPGWRAAFPVFGTVMLIAAGPTNFIARALLCRRPVVWIGLISYPLYLFHWPIFSFAHIVRDGPLSTRFTLSAIALSFALAAATYHFVERKWRRAQWRWTVPLLIAAFALIGAAGLAIWYGKIAPRSDRPELAKVVAALRERTLTNPIPGVRREGQFLAVGGKQAVTLFVGDSFGSQYLPRIAKVLQDVTPSSCGALMLHEGGVAPIPGVSNSEGKDSAELIRPLHKLLETRQEIDRVVISACWPYYFDEPNNYSVDGLPLATTAGRQAALANLRELLRQLKQHGKQVTLILDPPWDWRLAPQKFLKRTFSGVELGPAPSLRYVDFLSRGVYPVGQLRTEIEEIGSSEGVEVIDPAEYLVVDGLCVAADENGPIRYDSSHLRKSFAREKVLYLDHLLSR